MKRYEVVGPLRFLGHKKGEQFDTALDPKHEARLIRAGCIRVVADNVGPPEPPPGKPATTHTRRGADRRLSH